MPLDWSYPKYILPGRKSQPWKSNLYFHPQAVSKHYGPSLTQKDCYELVVDKECHEASIMKLNIC